MVILNQAKSGGMFIFKISQMSLSLKNRQIKHTKPKTKPYQLTNGIGLFLHISLTSHTHKQQAIKDGLCV